MLTSAEKREPSCTVGVQWLEFGGHSQTLQLIGMGVNPSHDVLRAIKAQLQEEDVHSSHEGCTLSVQLG